MVNRREVVWICGAFLAAGRALAATPLTFGDIFVRQGQFTPQLKAAAGQAVTMRGYMAPPLKADARFFVLTKMPMAACPFCGSEIDWPDDIVVVNTRGVISTVDFNVLIEVSGELELGTKTDPETGFLSLVRIVDARFRKL